MTARRQKPNRLLRFTQAATWQFRPKHNGALPDIQRRSAFNQEN